MSSSFLKNTLSCLKKIVLLQALQGCLTLTAFASFHIAELPVNEKSIGIPNPQDTIRIVSKVATPGNAPIALMAKDFVTFQERVFTYQRSEENGWQDFGRGLLSWLTLGTIDLIDTPEKVNFNKDKEKAEKALGEYANLLQETNSLKFGMGKSLDKNTRYVQVHTNFSLEADLMPSWFKEFADILFFAHLDDSTSEKIRVDFGERTTCHVSKTANYGHYEIKSNEKKETTCEYVPLGDSELLERVQGIFENIPNIKLNSDIKKIQPFLDMLTNEEDTPKNFYFAATNLGILFYNVASNKLYLYEPDNGEEVLSVSLSNERASPKKGSNSQIYNGDITLAYSTASGFGFISLPIDNPFAPKIDTFKDGAGFTDIVLSDDQKYQNDHRIHNGIIQFKNNKYLFEKTMDATTPDGGWSLDRIDPYATGGGGYYSAKGSHFKYFATEKTGLIQWDTITNTFVPVLVKNCANCEYPSIASINGIFPNNQSSFFIATNNGKYLLTEKENKTPVLEFESKGVTLIGTDTLEWNSGMDHATDYVYTSFTLPPGQPYTISFDQKTQQQGDDLILGLFSNQGINFATSYSQEELPDGFLRKKFKFISPPEGFTVHVNIHTGEKTLKDKVQMKNLVLQTASTIAIERISDEDSNFETTINLDPQTSIHLVLTDNGMKARNKTNENEPAKHLLQGIPLKKAGYTIHKDNNQMTFQLHYEVMPKLFAQQKISLSLPFQWAEFEEKIALLETKIRKEIEIKRSQTNINTVAHYNSPIKIAEIKGLYTANGLEKCPANTEWSTTQILPQYQLFDCRVVVKSIIDKEGNQYLPTNSAKGYLVSHLFPDHVFSFRSNTGQWLHTSMKVSPQGIDIAYGASPATLLNTTGEPVKFKNFNAQSMAGAPSEYIADITFSKSGDIFLLGQGQLSYVFREQNQGTYSFHTQQSSPVVQYHSFYPYGPVDKAYVYDIRHYASQEKTSVHADYFQTSAPFTWRNNVEAILTPPHTGQESGEQRKNRMTVSQNGTIFTIVNGPLLSVATTDFNMQTLRPEIKYSLQGLSAVNKMFTDANENLFIATNTGLIIGTPNAQKTEYSFKTLTTKDGLAANSVHTAAIANDGTLYLAYGNAGKGLSVGTPSKNQNGETSYSFKHYTKANSGSESGFLLAETVYALAVSANNELYIGYGPTGHGLTIASQNRENATFLPTHYRKEFGNLPSNSIKDIKIDHFDQVFLIPQETNLTGLFALGINTTEPTQKWNGPASSFHKIGCTYYDGCQ